MNNNEIVSDTNKLKYVSRNNNLKMNNNITLTSKSEEEFKKNLELFKQTRLDFTPESKFTRITSNNSSISYNKNKVQIKSAYDNDFRKLADICEVAIAKANCASLTKLQSNISPQRLRSPEEIQSNKSPGNNHNHNVHTMHSDDDDCLAKENKNLDKGRVPRVATDVDNRLNNQLLFQKLKDLEEVTAGVQNQKINQIK